MLDLGSSPRILITRLSAIGDCIHTLPLACALRRHYPAANISWVTQSAPASLLRNHFAVDEMITVDRRWMKSWSGIQSIRRQLRRHHFDVVIDPQSLTKSSVLGWLSGAQHRIGFSRGQGREISPWLATISVTPRRIHVVDRYLELLSPLSIQSPQVEFQLPRYEESEAHMDSWLRSRLTTPFVLLNPGAGWESKRWPHLRYAEVAKYLEAQHGLASLVLWSGSGEHKFAEDIVAHAGASAQLAPPTSLVDLATLCRRGRLFVGSDTGPMHIAAAVETPCVALFGPTKLAECGPYGEGHEPLQVRYQCGTSAERRGNDNRAMRAISTDLVCLACDRLVKRRANQAA